MLIWKFSHCFHDGKINFILSKDAYRRLMWKELLGFPFTLIYVCDNAVPYHFARSAARILHNNKFPTRKLTQSIKSDMKRHSGLREFTLNFQVLIFLEHCVQTGNKFQKSSSCDSLTNSTHTFTHSHSFTCFIA